MDRPETQQALVAETGSEGPMAEGTGPAVEASVLLPTTENAYGMFEALALGPEGATLAGGLLLEVSEEVTFELRMPDRTVFRARARVVEIVHGSPPAMKVVWTGVDDGDRQRLEPGG